MVSLAELDGLRDGDSDEDTVINLFDVAPIQDITQIEVVVILWNHVRTV